jgi:threonyl-tRNA synthetase
MIISTGIRQAQMDKVPFMAITGDRETAAQQVSLRLRSGTTMDAMPISEAIALIRSKIDGRETL